MDDTDAALMYCTSGWGAYLHDFTFVRLHQVFIRTSVFPGDPL